MELKGRSLTLTLTLSLVKTFAECQGGWQAVDFLGKEGSSDWSWVSAKMRSLEEVEADLTEAKLEIKAVAEEIKHAAKMTDEAEAAGNVIGFQRWVKAAEQLRDKEIRLLDKEIRLLDERAREHARLESAGVSLFSCSILTIWQMPESPHRRMALLFLPCFHLEEQSSSALRIAHQLRSMQH